MVLRSFNMTTNLIRRGFINFSVPAPCIRNVSYISFVLILQLFSPILYGSIYFSYSLRSNILIAFLASAVRVEASDP